MSAASDCVYAISLLCCDVVGPHVAFSLTPLILPQNMNLDYFGGPSKIDVDSYMSVELMPKETGDDV